MDKRFTGIALFIVGVAIGLLFASQPAGATHVNCARSYQVSWGDSLFSIALREGKTVHELAALNHITNINVIYAGSILCVEAGEVSTGNTNLNSSFDLIASYQFVNDPDNKWTLGRNGRAGLRHVYLLPKDAIHTYANPGAVQIASQSQTTEPILWLVRQEEEDNYTLVVLGDPQPLHDLELGNRIDVDTLFPPLSESDIVLLFAGAPMEPVSKPVSDLADDQVTDMTLEVSLQARDGTFVPVTITQVDYQARVDVAAKLYETSGIAFALHPAANQPGYELHLVLNDDGTIGPPGGGWSTYCANWAGSNWWNRFRRSWFGC